MLLSLTSERPPTHDRRLIPRHTPNPVILAQAGIRHAHPRRGARARSLRAPTPHARQPLAPAGPTSPSYQETQQPKRSIGHSPSFMTTTPAEPPPSIALRTFRMAPAMRARIKAIAASLMLVFVLTALLPWVSNLLQLPQTPNAHKPSPYAWIVHRGCQFAIALGAWVVLSYRLHLSPDGLTIHEPHTPERTYPWRDVRQLQITRAVRPKRDFQRLAIILSDRRIALRFVRVNGHILPNWKAGEARQTPPHALFNPRPHSQPRARLSMRPPRIHYPANHTSRIPPPPGPQPPGSATCSQAEAALAHLPNPRFHHVFDHGPARERNPLRPGEHPPDPDLGVAVPYDWRLNHYFILCFYSHGIAPSNLPCRSTLPTRRTSPTDRPYPRNELADLGTMIFLWTYDPAGGGA